MIPWVWPFLPCRKKNLFTTTNLNVNYLYGAKEGEKVLVKAKVVRIGKKIANIECKVMNEEGDIISTATSNLVVTSIKINSAIPE
nr:PaaI family thioesterase [Lentimicrobium sp. L6]